MPFYNEPTTTGTSTFDPPEYKPPLPTRACHVCMQPTKNLDYSICEECREAILFAKELRKAAIKNVQSTKM